MSSSDLFVSSNDRVFNSSIRSEHKEKPYSKATCSFVALAVITTLALVIAALGSLKIFGAIGTIGFIASLAVGGFFFLSSLSGIVYTALQVCSQPKEKKEIIESKPIETTPSIVPVKKEIDIENENIETTYWERMLTEKSLSSMFDMVANSHYEIPDQCAEFIVDYYIHYCIHQNPSFSLSPSDKALLEKSTAKQLKMRVEFSKELSGSTLPLPNNREVVLHPTVGDGTCGLHALIGVDTEGRYWTDPHKARKQFCDWIRQQRQAKNLPRQIVNVLQEYFHKFPLAPSGFRRRAEERFEHHHLNYRSLTLREAENRVQAFIDDDAVFNAYLENLADTGVYLLQDELAAAGKCFDKQIILYQPDWGTDGAGKTKFYPITKSGAETVHIWYNGFNHYQRATERPRS